MDWQGYCVSGYLNLLLYLRDPQNYLFKLFKKWRNVYNFERHLKLNLKCIRSFTIKTVKFCSFWIFQENYFRKCKMQTFCASLNSLSLIDLFGELENHFKTYSTPSLEVLKFGAMFIYLRVFFELHGYKQHNIRVCSFSLFESILISTRLKIKLSIKLLQIFAYFHA